MSRDDLAHVAIVGGGYLGSALAKYLQPPVMVATRSGRWRGDDRPAGVDVFALDVTHDPLEIGPLREARALVLCYAPGRTQDRRELYVEGTNRLLAATRPLPLRRIIWVGSTSAVPDIDGVVDESCTAWPTSERGIAQREAEQRVADHCRQQRVPYWVLRLGGLYGPGRGLDRIYGRRASEPLAGDGSSATNLIHRDDAIATIVAALQAPLDQGGIVHVVDDDHRSRREMYDVIAQARGIPPVTWESPPHVGSPTGKRVANDRLKRVLGVQLRYPEHELR